MRWLMQMQPCANMASMRPVCTNWPASHSMGSHAIFYSTTSDARSSSRIVVTLRAVFGSADARRRARWRLLSGPALRLRCRTIVTSIFTVGRAWTSRTLLLEVGIQCTSANSFDFLLQFHGAHSSSLFDDPASYVGVQLSLISFLQSTPLWSLVPHGFPFRAQGSVKLCASFICSFIILVLSSFQMLYLVCLPDFRRELVISHRRNSCRLTNSRSVAITDILPYIT